MSHTRGAQLQDLDLSGKLAEVYARDMKCYEPIEKLYYSVGKYELICIYCASGENLDVSDEYYPQCLHCCDKEKVKKRKCFMYEFSKQFFYYVHIFMLYK